MRGRYNVAQKFETLLVNKDKYAAKFGGQLEICGR